MASGGLSGLPVWYFVRDEPHSTHLGDGSVVIFAVHRVGQEDLGFAPWRIDLDWHGYRRADQDAILRRLGHD